MSPEINIERILTQVKNKELVPNPIMAKLIDYAIARKETNGDYTLTQFGVDLLETKLCDCYELKVLMERNEFTVISAMAISLSRAIESGLSQVFLSDIKEKTGIFISRMVMGNQFIHVTGDLRHRKHYIPASYSAIDILDWFVLKRNNIKINEDNWNVQACGVKNGNIWANIRVARPGYNIIYCKRLLWEKRKRVITEPDYKSLDYSMSDEVFEATVKKNKDVLFSLVYSLLDEDEKEPIDMQPELF